jgi:hypothetical protein
MKKEPDNWKIDRFIDLGVEYQLFNHHETPMTLSQEDDREIQKLVRTTFEYINNKNFDGLYDLISEDNKDTVDEYRNIELEFVLELSDIQFVSNTKNKDQAIVKVRYKWNNLDNGYLDKYIEEFYTLEKNEKGLWRITNIELNMMKFIVNNKSDGILSIKSKRILPPLLQFANIWMYKTVC